MRMRSSEATAVGAAAAAGLRAALERLGVGLRRFGTTDGNASAGSNNITATDYGYAAGLTYHLTPATSYGFALAGGGTNWNFARSLGSGRGDHSRPASMAPRVSDRLSVRRARFGQSLVHDEPHRDRRRLTQISKARAMWRAAKPVPLRRAGRRINHRGHAVCGLAGADFHSPSSREAILSGGGFGLTYASMNGADTRDKLGTRFR